MNVAIARDYLQIDDEIQLKVGFNPKRNCASFIPQFVDDDNLIFANSYYRSSIRIFIPNNSVNLEVGEIWNVKIVAYNIGKGLTNDERHYVYVNVMVLSRDEYLERNPNLSTLKFNLLKKSGDRILEEKSIPIEVVPEKIYQDKNRIVKVKLYMVAGKVFDIVIGEYFSREKFISHLAKSVGRPVNAVFLCKSFDRLPELPEVVDFHGIDF